MALAARDYDGCRRNWVEGGLVLVERLLSEEFEVAFAAGGKRRRRGDAVVLPSNRGGRVGSGGMVVQGLLGVEPEVTFSAVD